jgi:ElaB/YqjD/DUF883 family membrane-anchored ribosome-binding protein
MASRRSTGHNFKAGRGRSAEPTAHMSEDAIEETSPLQEATAKGREKLAQAQCVATDTLTGIANYTRANPWLAIAGAALVGGVVVALARPSRPRSRADVIRDWLDEAYAKMPSSKQVQSVVETTGVPDLVARLKKKLHQLL